MFKKKKTEAILNQAISDWKSGDETAKAAAEPILKMEYDRLLQLSLGVTEEDEMKQIAEDFEKLGDYRDSKSMAYACWKRAADLPESPVKEKKSGNLKVIGIYLLVETLFLLLGIGVLMFFCHAEAGIPLVDTPTAIGVFIACAIIQLLCCGISGGVTLMAMAAKPKNKSKSEDDPKKKKAPSALLAIGVALLGAFIFALMLLCASLLEMSWTVRIWFGVIIATHIIPTCLLFFKKR